MVQHNYQTCFVATDASHFSNPNTHSKLQSSYAAPSLTSSLGNTNKQNPLMRQSRRGLLRNCIFLVRIQAAKTGYKLFYWSRSTALPQLIQWTVGINRFLQLGSVLSIHILLVHIAFTHLLNEILKKNWKPVFFDRPL